MTAPATIPGWRLVEGHCPGRHDSRPCRTWRLRWPNSPWPPCWRCHTTQPAIETRPGVTFETFRPPRSPA